MDTTTTLRIMAYNIENMRTLFEKGRIAGGQRERALAIAQVIREIHPHLLGVVEAADKEGQHMVFLEETGLDTLGFRIAKSPVKRPRQDLVFYYRDPLEPVALDSHVDFYDQWIEDIDEDGIMEVCSFERRPLEGRFRHTGTGEEFLTVLVSTKSKGVFSINDLMRHQHLALANRKRQLAQTKKLRQRAEDLMDDPDHLPFVFMGDFNDEPGLDSLERLLGVSSIETMMGSVFEPDRILHNALWHMSREPVLSKELWTTEYPDLIVQNFGNHKGWLDHIITDPAMAGSSASVRVVPGSGRVGTKSEAARLASDHYAIYCDLDFGDGGHR